RALGAAASGNVAITFALTLIPIVVGTGGAIDYVHAMSVRAAMQNAADAAALGLCQSARTLSAGQLSQSATNLFRGDFARPEAQNVTVNATFSSGVGVTCNLTVNA